MTPRPAQGSAVEQQQLLLLQARAPAISGVGCPSGASAGPAVLPLVLPVAGDVVDGRSAFGGQLPAAGKGSADLEPTAEGQTPAASSSKRETAEKKGAKSVDRLFRNQSRKEIRKILMPHNGIE